MSVGYIAVIVCLVLTTAGRKDVIYDIGKTHCPCTRFCSDDIKTVNTNGTEELIKTRSSPDDDNFDVCTTTDIYQPKETVSESRAQTVLCCGNCSCEEDCWKTSSCCPDKNNIRDEPALTCRSPVVKPIWNDCPSNLGYHVIDACPLSEINDTLVSKCTTDSINNLADLIWVFDEHQDLTFKNEYCALCHHVTYYVKWQLRVKCESLSSTAVLLPLFMLDDQCELKLENPENTTATSFPVCMVVAGYNHYDHCNQTGLWATYGADIERSCNIYHSPFFVESLIHVAGVPVTKKYIKAYKNVFCFSCNTDETLVPNPVCVLPEDFGQPQGEDGLTTLIDYRGFHNFEEEDQSPSSVCKRNEVMDKITGQCRTLTCPFGSQAVMETCMSMFDQIINLPVGINYGLTATWSRSSHSKTDDLQSQKYLGFYIMNEKRKHSRFSEGGCILNGDYLQFISNVNASEFANDEDIKNGSSYIEINQNKEANFVLQTFLLTTESCQLQDVINKSLKPFEEPLTVYNWDGDLEMNLTVSVVSEKDFDLTEAYLIYSIFQSCKNRQNSNEVCVPVSSYSVSNETQCPKIGVKYSELSSYLTDSNYTIIESMFPGNKTENDEVVYTCLDEYYRWLDSAGVRPPLVNSHPNSGEDILPSRLPMFISICFTLDLII